MRTIPLREWTGLAIGAAMAAALSLGGFALWSKSREQELLREQAEALLARIAPDIEASPYATPPETQAGADGYAAWKELATADLRLRMEAASLVQETQYLPLVSAYTELLGRSLVGFDADGQASRALVEQLVCERLNTAPATVANPLPQWFVPWLNPAALDLERCAGLLTDSVIAAGQGSTPQGANLLALMLDALPAEAAAPHVNRLVAQVATAPPGDVPPLFNALRRVDSTLFPAAFVTALRTLTGRIARAESSAAIAVLFDSVNSLKYAVPPEQLVPVLDAGIARMLERDDPTLTRDLYFILTDLKTTHPETSFGPRVDYLLQGINIYSDALEIYDYSRVLRLNDRYPGQDAVLAAALLDGIRNLAEADYLSGIVPLCKRYLEVSAALDYANFLAGAQLLFEQLHRDNFIFSRPCLLDSGLVTRIEAADRARFAGIVVDALTDGRSPTRIAESIELLGKLDAGLDTAQLRHVSASLTSAMSKQTDSYWVASLVGAISRAELDFAPEFYSELFVLAINAPPLADGSAVTPPLPLLQALPEAERTYIVKTALDAWMPAQMDPAVLANHVELLLALRQWMTQDERENVITTLTAAIDEPRNIPVMRRLTRALLSLSPQQTNPPRGPLLPSLVRHIGTSGTRAELAELLPAAAAAGAANATDEAARAELRAAAVRFLEELAPGDAGTAMVGQILTKPSEPESPGLRERAARPRPSRGLTLEPADVERLSARFVHALASEADSRPVADYALSMRMLANYSRPQELDALLHALHARLDAPADTATHELLVSTWIAVEDSTNAQQPPEERIPLYVDVLRLPLTNAASRALLVDAAGGIVKQDFAGDWWKLLEWTALEPVTAEMQE